MIEEMSQVGGSEVPVIEDEEVFISAEDVAEGPSQPEDLTEKSHLSLFNQVGYNKSLIHSSGSSSCF